MDFDRQGDLFSGSFNRYAPRHAPIERAGGKPKRSSSASSRLQPSTAKFPADDETMARHLEETGAYRVLRRLEPRPVVGRGVGLATDQGRKIGLILDTETTGLDHRSAEIIELGMVLFSYDVGGICDVLDVYSELRQPADPIPEEITRITGITDEMVAGRRIDPQGVEAFIAAADCIIAHNAKFDRPFCEAFVPAFRHKAWGCSVAEVDWAALGFEGSKLTYLIGQCGWFHNGHRAVDDCHALLEVLDHQARTGGSGFSVLTRSMALRTCRIWAHMSPFETKDLLKARGYRWSDGSDGRLKSWWIDVAETGYEAEQKFLNAEVYRGGGEPRVEWMSAIDRYRAV